MKASRQYIVALTTITVLPLVMEVLANGKDALLVVQKRFTLNIGGVDPSSVAQLTMSEPHDTGHTTASPVTDTSQSAIAIDTSQSSIAMTSSSRAGLLTAGVLNSAVSDSIQNQVSWQSAFWALIPVALNSMTQPSGMVFGCPSEYGFALRSSPLVCGADALYTMLLFIFNAAALRSPRAAALKIAKWRFRDIPDREEGSLRNLQENTIFRIFVFVVGALSQVIKLCAFQGLPYTQLWALLFLGSFVSLELVVLLLGRNWRASGTTELRDNSGDIEVALGVGVVSGGLGYSLYFITRAVFAIAERYTEGPRWLYTFCLFICGFTFSLILVMSRDREDSVVATLVAVFAPLPMLFAAILTAHKVSSTATVTLLPYDITHSIFFRVSLGFALCITLLTAFKLAQRATPDSDHGLATYFLLLNLITALLWYGFCYDPEGTIKPSWTNQLG